MTEINDMDNSGVNTMNDIRIPAEVSPPRDFILDELEAHNWTQDDLARLLNRPKSYISELINGKRAINLDVSQELEVAFGIEAQFWLNIQNMYDLYISKNSEKFKNFENIKKKKIILEEFNSKELIQRGWIHDSNDADILEAQILTLFEINSLDEKPFLNCAARKSDYRNDYTIKQIAWVKKAEAIAFYYQKLYPAFDEGTFEKTIREKMPSLMSCGEDLKHVVNIYKELGVMIIGLKSLVGMKMQACQFWLDKKIPVIAMSFSYDKLDRFWFNLLHETAHIIHQDAIDAPILELEDNPTDKPDFEVRADNFAKELIMPQNIYDRFLLGIKNTNSSYIRKEAKKFADFLNIHPSMVYGRLQSDGILPWGIKTSNEKALAFIKDIMPCEGF